MVDENSNWLFISYKRWIFWCCKWWYFNDKSWAWKKRPTYFTIKDKDILWFIPLSSKVDKYKKIVDNKLKKYGRCDTILIREILGKDSVVLLQNAFPTLEKYIDHAHLLDNGKPAKVVQSLKDEILQNFEYLLKLKSKGVNLFFTDIDSIKEKMLEEIEK